MKKGAIKMREINWRYYFKDSEGSVLTIELTMAQIEGAKSGCIQQLRKHFKDCELLDRVEGTGLFDNTGKEIFEKDIVCAYNGKYIGEVVYFPPEFVVQNLKDMRLNFLEPNGKNKINFDVIGNVYQNPQLLEAEVARLTRINQGCESEAHLYDDLLRRCRAENAKLRKVADAAHVAVAYLQTQPTIQHILVQALADLDKDHD